MRAMFGDPRPVASEIGGQFRQGTDRFVSPPLLKGVCKLIWPKNTDAEVATICKCSVRNGARILSGELALPARLLAFINVKLTERP